HQQRSADGWSAIAGLVRPRAGTEEAEGRVLGGPPLGQLAPYLLGLGRELGRVVGDLQVAPLRRQLRQLNRLVRRVITVRRRVAAVATVCAHRELPGAVGCACLYFRASRS